MWVGFVGFGGCSRFGFWVSMGVWGSGEFYVNFREFVYEVILNEWRVV